MTERVPQSIAAARLHELLPSEPGRLAELRELGLADPSSVARIRALDAIVEQVCALLMVPVSVVSIMLEDQQVFHARSGVDITGTPREVSFCSFVVASGEQLVVEDAASDPFFADHPLVVDGVVGSYAGVPLVTTRNQVLGTLCAIDAGPHEFDGPDLELLEALAARVVAELESIRDRARLDALVDVEANLYRREAFGQIVAIEQRRHARSCKPLVLARFADARTLAEFAHALRPFDIAGRVDGNGAGVLLPDTTPAAARRMFGSACGRVELVELVGDERGTPAHARIGAAA